jgi:plastocyanin
MNRRFISIAALGLAALALAACGSSDDDATTADTAAAPAASDTAAAPATSDTAAAPAETAATDTAAAAGGQVLTGTVGPGFTITMDQTSVPAGTYTLELDDQSAEHNFHLTGEGVDVTTTVPEIAKQSFEVTLVAGTYNFVCDPHAQGMKGELTVT